MSVWGALAGGFLGTLVLTTALAAGSQLRITRMDIPFLLGTACTDNRTRARVLGYVLHFLAGLVFALVYYAGFVVLGRAGWGLGLLFGIAHALFSGTTLVNVLPAGRASAHGHPEQCGRFLPPAGAAGLHAAELRPANAGAHPAGPHGVRRDRRRVRGGRGTLTSRVGPMACALDFWPR